MDTRRTEVDLDVEQLGVNAAAAKRGQAALVLSYRCTIACRHCLFASCSARPDVVMTVDQALRALALAHDLGRVVHIAGGEIMMYWPRLKEVLVAAARDGLAPHFLQTNCSFASSDEIVRERLGFAREHGVRGLYFSADPLHQEHVSPQNVLRVRRIAYELFGPPSVFGPTLPDEAILDLPNIARDDARLGAEVRKMHLMLIGSAYHELGRHFDDRPLEELDDEPWSRGGACRVRDCARQFDQRTLWEVHIDPYDNIQTNCGVILGSARLTTAREVLDRSRPHPNEMVQSLISGGPFGLAEFARRHGYRLPAKAKSKCALCYEVRSFLRPWYPDTFGPAEVYPAWDK
jgi:hypothetical protein